MSVECGGLAAAFEVSIRTAKGLAEPSLALIGNSAQQTLQAELGGE